MALIHVFGFFVVAAGVQVGQGLDATRKRELEGQLTSNRSERVLGKSFRKFKGPLLEGGSRPVKKLLKTATH
ncbi:uncharacterized protein EAF02_006989 [Botrytis sinoallii]|uniref:uncharacterized protein n=1 Tax=Botrytis sinoallii TaxID=1463999 RepID=UPI0019016C5A|nr:uncharacterized protein EAF02_006989 [Botrytis sinoallii]KAF7881098.1 hypothetical protein EAF02_006989 [Botrytis sinoallii]